MEDRVGALETAVDDAVDHGLPPECAKMLRDIVFRAHLDVGRRALLGDLPARVEPMTMRLPPGARAVRKQPEWYFATRRSRTLSCTYQAMRTAGETCCRVGRGEQVAAAEGGPALDTALGVASLDFEGLYPVGNHGYRVIWGAAGADSLKKRLLV